MKRLVKELWDGEPVYLIGGLTVIAVSVGETWHNKPGWAGMTVIGLVAFNQWLQRRQVTPQKTEKKGRHRKSSTTEVEL